MVDIFHVNPYLMCTSCFQLAFNMCIFLIMFDDSKMCFSKFSIINYSHLQTIFWISSYWSFNNSLLMLHAAIYNCCIYSFIFWVFKLCRYMIVLFVIFVCYYLSDCIFIISNIHTRQTMYNYSS